MNLHSLLSQERDDDLYEFMPELGLSPSETAQMQEADALNDEILASTGGEKKYMQWELQTCITRSPQYDNIFH